MGYWLCNFLEWADKRGVDLLTCEYVEHINGRYQTEMLQGIWSYSGKGLSPRTVNNRVSQACEYLTWLQDKNIRGPFSIPTRVTRVAGRSATSAVGHHSRTVLSRIGKVRERKRRLRMPKEADVGVWLKSVYAKFGLAFGLMAELVLKTALRRQEVACWRVDTLPKNIADWVIANPDAPHSQQAVLVTIKYGCKGRMYGTDHGDKIGPEGIIRVPLELAQRLHHYLLSTRNTALKKWVKAGRSATEQRERLSDAVHLFMREDSGERITSKMFYNAWTGVELPFKGWCPHLGRDWWACSTLHRELEKHEHLIHSGLDVAHALLESASMSVIRLQIMPQLRHAQENTCLTYLQWIADTLGFNLSIEYQESLDDGDE